jgi:hypothetical protein
MSVRAEFYPDLCLCSIPWTKWLQKMIVGILMKTYSWRIGISPRRSTYSHCRSYDSLTQSSQDRLYQGYGLLVRHIPNLKLRLVDQDVSELSTYFRDVGSSSIPSTNYVLIIK